MGCTIIGCGKALPSLEISNDDFLDLVDTNDEWIIRRTGIKSRRIAANETTVDLAEAAARQALGWSEEGWHTKRLSAEDIDLVVFSTVTPDAIVPSCAALLARRLGLDHAVAFDMNAACTGFIYGLSVVESLLAASQGNTAGAQRRNPYRKALVIGAERISRITNWQDRSTCVLLGDGAGAAVVEWNEAKPGIMSTFLENSLDTENALTCAMSFDSKQPFDESGVSESVMAAPDPSLSSIDEELGINAELAPKNARQLLTMNGQKVFKFATRAMGKAVEEVCRRASVSMEQIKYIVPHQANERIIRFAAKRYHMPLDKFQISITHRGNASSACVPMALSDLFEAGKLASGDKVILVGFGGGFTSGAILLEV